VPDELERLRALFAHVHELENNMSQFRKVMLRITETFAPPMTQPEPFPLKKPKAYKHAA
jgi:hypothetical protein